MLHDQNTQPEILEKGMLVFVHDVCKVGIIINNPFYAQKRWWVQVNLPDIKDVSFPVVVCERYVPNYTEKRSLFYSVSGGMLLENSREERMYLARKENNIGHN